MGNSEAERRAREFELWQHAMQLVGQLPDNAQDALMVLNLMRDAYQDFIERSDPNSARTAQNDSGQPDAPSMVNGARSAIRLLKDAIGETED